MNNNDILRRIRFTFDFSDDKMKAIFQHEETKVSRENICAWLKKEDDEGFENCSDRLLATFLNGLITEKRGRKNDVKVESFNKINNNQILTKLKIALNLKAESVLEILALSDCHISKHELSAFFRNPKHKHFRECKDQILRNFLSGIQKKYHKQA